MKTDEKIISVPSGLLGMTTLKEIETQLKKLSDGRKETNVSINLSNSSFEHKYTPELARLLLTYNCNFLGISIEKESEIEAIIQTGWFIKENLDSSKYLLWLKEKIEIADFPLMVLDNTLLGVEPRYVIVQPLAFENNILRYRKLLSKYVEPYMLEEALKIGNSIWTTETKHALDLSDKLFGLRFASNEKERAILTILSNVLSGRLKGFITK